MRELKNKLKKMKEVRLCRDLGETATRILASRDQLKGNFEIVLPLVTPGAELSKLEFKEKVLKWREALAVLERDPPSYEEAFPLKESELKRVSGGENPSDLLTKAVVPGVWLRGLDTRRSTPALYQRFQLAMPSPYHGQGVQGGGQGPYVRPMPLPPLTTSTVFGACAPI